MAMKSVFDTLEEIPEDLRSHYESREGKYHLVVEGAEDTATLKRNLQAARRAEQALKDKIKAWEDLGMSQDDIQLMLTNAERVKIEEAEKRGEWEKLRTQMNDKHAADLKKKDDLIAASAKLAERRRDQLQSNLVDARATAAIAAAKGVPELLLPIVKRFIAVTESDDGEFSTSIVDEKGGARVNGKGEPLTLDELLVDMKASNTYGRAFEGSGQSGGGTPPGGGGGGGGGNPPAGTPSSWAAARTPEEKALYLAHQKTLKGGKAA